MKPVRIGSFLDFNQKYITENVDTELEMDETILDNLVDLVGSEEDVEQCAKEAFEELEKSFNSDSSSFEFGDNDTPEKLAISALLVKLVECGKLDPQAADDFLEQHI